MKSPGELMEKRRNADQHVLQHGEIRREHMYIYIYSYIHICFHVFCIVLFLC